jgi:nitroreductase
LPEEEKVARLEKVCREFRPFPEARAELVRSKPDQIFKGLIGAYGRVNDAPCYAAFIGDLSSPHVQETTGYTGEGIILEATALGLNTCWVGGFFRPEMVKHHIPLRENEKILSVTPIGYAVEKKGFSEKSLSAFARSHRRRPLDDLTDGPIPEPWMEKAIGAARLAPSAVNRQPWRFRIQKNAVFVSTDSRRSASPISKRLDCGIAMLHLELGARTAGVNGKWEFLKPPEVARFFF